MTAIDPREFRRACGHFLTGVTIVTTRGRDGTPVGITANAFLSASLDPPLVLVSVDKRSSTHPVFAGASSFIVHVLGEGQDSLSSRFARRGEDKFAGLPTRVGLGGAPVLPGYLALFECTRTDAVDAGDHTLFIGRAERVEAPIAQRFPLGFYRGAYVRLEPKPVEPQPEVAAELWALGWS